MDRKYKRYEVGPTLTVFDGNIANTYFGLQKCCTMSRPPMWADHQFRVPTMFCSFKPFVTNPATKNIDKPICFALPNIN